MSVRYQCLCIPTGGLTLACLSDQGLALTAFEISGGIKATAFNIKEREVKAENFQSQNWINLLSFWLWCNTHLFAGEFNRLDVE